MSDQDFPTTHYSGQGSREEGEGAFAYSVSLPQMPVAAPLDSSEEGEDAGMVAASFDYSGGYGGSYGGGYIGHAVNPYFPRGRRSMIDRQKYRNNYASLDLRDLFSVSRRHSKSHWFLRPVISLRHGSHIDGFHIILPTAKVAPAPAPHDNPEREMGGTAVPPMSAASLKPQEIYDIAGLVSDIAWEDLRTSNAVAIWRKGVEGIPYIMILKSEQVTWTTVAGQEILRIQWDTSLSSRISRTETITKLREKLGDKMVDDQLKGGCTEIVKGLDDKWDFEVMTAGSRGDGLERPEIEGILDPIDWLELMGIGDWNLAWFRKDVVRLAKKGYKGTSGGGVTSGVDITKPQIKNLGEGLGKFNGCSNVPANHDVDFSYFTVPAENFDPKQVESWIDKLKLYGGIEGAVLLGGFTQQNGAAPTLMRNGRVSAFARRERISRFLNAIFSRSEFSDVMEACGGKIQCGWSNRTLYSVDELLSMVTKTADGVASTRTRREILSLDHDQEGDRLEAEHANRHRVTPAYESRQGMLPAIFPELQTESTPPASGGEGGEGGRPPSSSDI